MISILIVVCILKIVGTYVVIVLFIYYKYKLNKYYRLKYLKEDSKRPDLLYILEKENNYRLLFLMLTSRVSILIVLFITMIKIIYCIV